MPGAAAVLAAGIAASGLIAVLAVAIVVAKAVRDARARRRRSELARVRPLVMRLASAPDADASDVPAGDEEAVRDLALSLLPKLRGVDRAGLVRLLERTGAIEVARARTYRRGSTGRARAAEMLGTSGVARGLPELARLLKDRDGEVRSVAARALGRLGRPEAAPFLIAAIERPRPVQASIVGMALARLGAGAVEHLRAGLSNPDPAARAICAELLGLHGAVIAAEDLERVLAEDDDAEVRTRAALSLGRIGSTHSIPALVPYLAVSEPLDLRVAAARSIGLIAPERAKHRLATTLGDEHAVALAGASALAEAGPDAVRWLRQVAASGVGRAPEVREALDRRTRRLESSQRVA